jgi:hypothetical protein
MINQIIPKLDFPKRTRQCYNKTFYEVKIGEHWEEVPFAETMWMRIDIIEKIYNKIVSIEKGQI